MPSFLQPLLKEPGLSHRLENTRNGQTVAFTLLTAFDSASRRTGLLRHDSLPEGSALIIAPSNAVHTYTGLPPWRMAAALRGFAVVELPAGALAAADTVVGDRLVVVRAE